MPTRTTHRNPDTLFRALSRLARSSWGSQGVGECPDPMTRLELLSQRLARTLPGQPDHVLALTLSGFRRLEKLRFEAEIRKIAQPRRALRKVA